MPTAAARGRSNGGGGEMLIALALGLGFLLVDGILAALGSSGILPPLAVAVVAPLLFILIGVWRLRACERP
jgi:lipopolysaccharide export system permease protein